MNTSEEPDYLDILAQQQKQQDSIYKRDIEQLKMSMENQSAQFAQRSDMQESMRKDRKLDLEEQGLELKKKELEIKKKVANKKPTSSK